MSKGLIKRRWHLTCQLSSTLEFMDKNDQLAILLQEPETMEKCAQLVSKVNKLVNRTLIDFFFRLSNFK